MKKLIIIILLFNCFVFYSQDELPYYEIPDYPESYTTGNVLSRMIDGLGFRFYWASEGLKEKDLNYRASKDSRSSIEIIEHIHVLSKIILNSVQGKPNISQSESKLNFKNLRKKTLENFEISSQILKKTKDLSKFKIVFENQGMRNEFPFWNQINGPIEDAVWHSGQLVILRRASGNPFNSKASVFTGKVEK